MSNICTKHDHGPSCSNQAQDSYPLESLVLSKEYSKKMIGRRKESIIIVVYLGQQSTGDVEGYVSLYFDISSSCYSVLTVLFCLWESVRYWMPMWQTHKTLIRLLVLIY